MQKVPLEMLSTFAVVPLHILQTLLLETELGSSIWLIFIGVISIKCFTVELQNQDSLLSRVYTVCH